MKLIHFIQFIFLLLILPVSFTAVADDREDEIRARMWETPEEVFVNREIPAKWKDESAVILAQLNRFEYKKPMVINELYTNRYFHNRIRINDKSALNEYSEIKFLSGSGRKLKVFTGFKVIKSDGTEVIVDNAEAVEMEQVENGEKMAYKKIAIPNLEIGDILDYYICEDRIISLSSKFYYFTPVQFHLPQKFPVINQRLEFNVQRRCFISLRSINGAPELKMEYDEVNEEQNYTLVDVDREAVKDIRWFYPYLELPTIKFRAAYASGKAVRQSDVLLGEPGVVKKEVSREEISNFVSYLIANLYNDPKPILKHVKKNVDKKASNFEKAKAGYYYQRNQQLQWDEITTIADKNEWQQHIGNTKDNNVKFLDRFSGFLANLDLPYEIVIAVPRNVSRLDDVLLEAELKYLMRVKQGDDWLYLSELDNFSLPGEIDADLQGAEAYVVDGLANFKDWELKKITLPVTDKNTNVSEGILEVSISDDFKNCAIEVTRKVSGNFKKYHQYSLLDFYDYKAEESTLYDMKENFEGTLWMKKRLLNLRESYLSGRDELKAKHLEYFMDGEYDFDLSSISDLSIKNNGRFEEAPEMVYSFKLNTDGLISRVGNNYLLDAGKLIEKQLKLEESELERKQGIYMSSPRTYSYKIGIFIPDGYEVQGLDKFANQVETSQGGFISSARMEEGKLIIETTKYYSKNYASKEQWPEYVKFLNAASNFSEQKVLLRKAKVGS